MIVSASRRTDIPNYYSDWFFNRLKAGYALVKNPMNAAQIRRVELSPEAVDCFVFWTKNPAPMLPRLEELRDYAFYFQFTLTGYGRDIEPGIPHKREVMLDVFRQLAGRVGKERVIWRYDPILITDRYTPEYHVRAFGEIAAALEGCTEKAVISFVDVYGKNRKALEQLGMRSPEAFQMRQLASELACAARQHGMRTAACAEALDLSSCGVEKNSCIDGELVERLTGRKPSGGKDRNQRSGCGCMASADIGAYDTCPSRCRYCYADRSGKAVEANRRRYDPEAETLCGEIKENIAVSK